MNIFLYCIIFIIGTVFGSFYTLAVYRIPKRQDILHTHSYCPNCNHKLGFFELIPVLSYIFLGGKCKHCKQKIRPRYLILELLSGCCFLLFALALKIDVYQLDMYKLGYFAFLALYMTCLILIAGIDKEYRKIDKAVLAYGIIISIIYIVYLYIIEKTSIYRYIIYLVLFVLLLISDSIYLKKCARNSYLIGLLTMIAIMAVFSGEYVAINTIILTLLATAIYVLTSKVKNKNHENKEIKLSTEVRFGYFSVISNLLILFLVLCFVV